VQLRFFANWLPAVFGIRLARMKRAPDSPHSKYLHVYPVVRIDRPFNEAYPTNTLAVVKILTSEEAAAAKVSRLSEVNAGKRYEYFYCTSRLVE
jgi:hypothetical protein